MRILCNNGGAIELSQKLIDAINIIKTNQSIEENIRDIDTIKRLINTIPDQSIREDCYFFIESIYELTIAI
jgi:hypothetical protein